MWEIASEHDGQIKIRKDFNLSRRLHISVQVANNRLN